ncbi:hypothetical protein G9P44_004496 [Scheffersomyces stipitis]|nr:hypothetical protein G9P44_004496 [Scheffersomyces stipitis]
MSTVAELIEKWLEEYPAEKAEASYSTPEEVLDLINKSPETTTVVDLRNDREPSVLKTSVHIPATGIAGYDDLKARVIDVVTEQKPEVKNIVIHCNSSRKRAVRVAGWIQDYINENDVKDYKVTILKGGIAGWFNLDEPYQKVLIPVKDE